MARISISKFRLSRNALAALLMGGAAGLACADPPPAQYSVINLDPEGGGGAFLNARGEAAVGSFVYNTNHFFDGDRLHDVGSLGGGFTVMNALNNNGVVVGYSDDGAQPYSQIHGFRWTVAGGMRAIPGSAGGAANDINDNDQAVGERQEAGVIAGSATRFDPDGRVVRLGPVIRSSATVINNAALAAGTFLAPNDVFHAAVWGGGSRLIDLGTLDSDYTAIQLINERGDVAGYAGSGNVATAFAWNARDGLVRTGAQGFPSLLSTALNDLGEIVGEMDVPGGTGAYLWSRARGLTRLPGAGAVRSSALDVNNKSESVGLFEDASGAQRAVRWDGVANPVDLNTLLVRPPAGLVLEAGTAINDAGTILAYSNAGLVMLRPGARGTDAPVLGPVVGLPNFPDFGQDVHLTLGFVDNDPGQTHTVGVTWYDSCPAPAPVLTEANGVGNIVIQHRFCQSGSNLVVIRVTDSAGRSTETRRQLYIEAPGVAALEGRGTLAWTPPGTGAGKPPLQFSIWAPLASTSAAVVASATAAAAAATTTTTTTGANQAHIGFDGPFHFRADAVSTATRAGQAVRLEGSGHLNGRAGYRFVVDAVDGGQGGNRQHAGSGDRLHVRIVHTDADGQEAVDYDNGASSISAGASASASASGQAATAPTTQLTRGDIAVRD